MVISLWGPPFNPLQLDKGLEQVTIPWGHLIIFEDILIITTGEGESKLLASSALRPGVLLNNVQDSPHTKNDLTPNGKGTAV